MLIQLGHNGKRCDEEDAGELGAARDVVFGLQPGEVRIGQANYVVVDAECARNAASGSHYQHVSGHYHYAQPL